MMHQDVMVLCSCCFCRYELLTEVLFSFLTIPVSLWTIEKKSPFHGYAVQVAVFHFVPISYHQLSPLIAIHYHFRDGLSLSSIRPDGSRQLASLRDSRLHHLRRSPTTPHGGSSKRQKMKYPGTVSSSRLRGHLSSNIREVKEFFDKQQLRAAQYMPSGSAPMLSLFIFKRHTDLWNLFHSMKPISM